MNDYINIGKIINTFGIKGELKIKSDFEYKDRAFHENAPLYIGIDKVKEVVNTHRFHKNNDLVTFKGYTNINEVLKYKDDYVYVLRSDLNLQEDEYLYNDLLYVEVNNENEYMGTVKEILNNYSQIILRIKTDKKEVLVPLVDEYIVKFDKEKRILYTKNIQNLL